MTRTSFTNLPRLFQEALAASDPTLLSELFHELRQWQESYPRAWRSLQKHPLAGGLLRAIEDAYVDAKF